MNALANALTEPDIIEPDINALGRRGSSKKWCTRTRYRSLAFLGFPNYIVGTNGTVWSWPRRWRRGEWMRRPIIWYSRDGHFGLYLSHNGKAERFFVHQLVLEAFVGPCPEGMECRYLDNDPLNNCLENLCWDDCEDASSRGRHAPLLPGGTSR